MKQYLETLYDSWGQEYQVDEVFFEAKTDHQHLVIFQNSIFGRVMALDGVIQTTEKDEFIYHEMMVHVPLFAHGSAKNVLIVGGGDGGILREVCRHKAVANITQVEIDDKVIEMCKEYLPGHSDGAFNDPRLNIVIDDGINFVKNTEQRFDVIISDSTDPIGPGESLFTESFYSACKGCLNPGGVMVTQNGVAFMQLDEVTTTKQRMEPHYLDNHFYCVAMPTYVGGFMTLAWATDNQVLRQQPLSLIESRFKQAGFKTRYYNPAIHLASFALPQFIIDAIES